MLPIAYNALVTPFFHVIPSQDVVANSLVPASIITRGNFYLDQYRRYIVNNYAEQHFAADVNGHLVSLTPIMAGVLAIPFMGAGFGTGWIARTVNVFDVAKFSAVLIAALAVLAFFLAAATSPISKRRPSPPLHSLLPPASVRRHRKACGSTRRVCCSSLSRCGS